MFPREVLETIGLWRNPWGAVDLDYYPARGARFRGWCLDEPAGTRYRRYSESSSRDGARMLLTDAV